MNASPAPMRPVRRRPLRLVGVIGALAVAPVVAGTAGVASASLNQAISFTSPTPTGAIVGGASYVPTATGGDSGNPVTFSISPRSTGICTLAAGAVSFTGPGSCVVNANQAGGGSYNPAPEVSQAFGTCEVAALTSTCTFTFAGMAETFTVPDNVSTMDVVAIGGGGGGGDGVGVSSGAPGGDGARVSVVGLPVIPGDEVPVFVGGRGDGGYAGGGGGSTNVGVLPADPDTIIAGGGGGGGFAGPGAADGGGGDGAAGGTAAGGDGRMGSDAVAFPGEGGADGTGGTGGPGQVGPPLAVAGDDGGDGDGGAGAHRSPNDGGGGPSTPGALGAGGAGGDEGYPAQFTSPTGGSGGGGYGGGGGGSSHGGGGGAGGSYGPPLVVALTTYATASNGAPGHGDGLPGSATVTFARQGGLLAFTSAAPSAAVIGGTYTPTVPGAPSGAPVTLGVDGASVGICTESGGVVTMVGVGTCTLVAAQTGTLSYRPDQVTQTFTVSKVPQAIAFTSAAPQGAVAGGTPYTPTATGGASGLPVVLAVSGASAGTCAMTAGVVSFTEAGTCTITATQAGDGTYLAAEPASQVVAVASVPAASAQATELARGDVGVSSQSSRGPVTVVQVPGPGVVSQSGFAGATATSLGRHENATARGATVCKGRVTAARQGPVTVTCALTATGRRELRRRSLRIRLVTAFTPTGGVPTSVVTTVVMKRVGSAATRRVPVAG